MVEALEMTAMVLLFCALLEMHPIDSFGYALFLFLVLVLVVAEQRHWKFTAGKPWLPGHVLLSLLLLLNGVLSLFTGRGPSAAAMQAALLTWIALTAMYYWQGKVPMPAAHTADEAAYHGEDGWVERTATRGSRRERGRRPSLRTAP